MAIVARCQKIGNRTLLMFKSAPQEYLVQSFEAGCNDYKIKWIAATPARAETIYKRMQQAELNKLN